MGPKKHLINSWPGGASALKIFRASPSAAAAFARRQTDDTGNLLNPLPHLNLHILILLLVDGTRTQGSNLPSTLLPSLSYQSLEGYHKMCLKLRAYFSKFRLSAGNAPTPRNCFFRVSTNTTKLVPLPLWAAFLPPYETAPKPRPN